MNYKLLVGRWWWGAFSVLLGGQDNATNNFKQFFYVKNNRLILSLVQKISFVKLFKPITSLITFFWGDSHFVGKIGGAFGIYRFSHISTDRSSRTQQLLTHYKFFTFKQQRVQIYNPHSELKAFISDDIFLFIVNRF